MKRITIIFLISMLICLLTGCETKENDDVNSSNNNVTDSAEKTDNEIVLSDIWYSNQMPITFNDLKSYLLDGCWIYVHQDYQLYTQVDLIAFSDFPVMAENVYYQLGNDDYLYANVITSPDIDETIYERYSKYGNTKIVYPSIPLGESASDYFDNYYWYDNFTFENNQSVDNENINVCYTRHDDAMKWYLTMDNFDFENREIHFKGVTKYEHYAGDVTNGPWELVEDVEDNECTFKHFTSIDSAKEYIYTEYIEPLKPQQ